MLWILKVPNLTVFDLFVDPRVTPSHAVHKNLAVIPEGESVRLVEGAHIGVHTLLLRETKLSEAKKMLTFKYGATRTNVSKLRNHTN